MRQNYLLIVCLLFAATVLSQAALPVKAKTKRVCPKAQILKAGSDKCTCSDNNLYKKAGDSCLLRSDIDRMFEPDSNENFSEQDATKVYYRNVETYTLQTDTEKDIGKSGTFDYYYLEAAVGCQKHKITKSCQTLANLCVLQLYDMNTKVCQLYQKLTRESPRQASPVNYPDKNFKEGMPWIYYNKEIGAKDIIEKSARIKFRASFNFQAYGIMNKLRLKLAKYTLKGDFMGFEEVTDQLVICQESSDELDRILKIGVTVSMKCDYDLSKLTDDFGRPAEENFFYDLFIEDYDKTLIDIPILIKNFKDEDSSYPNQKQGEADTIRWRLVRRFFLFDTISGVLASGTKKFDPALDKQQTEVIRYAKEIKLSVRLDRVEDEMIYVPYLYINYKERTTQNILDKKLPIADKKGPLTQVEFSTEYSSDTPGFTKFAIVMFWIMLAVVILMWLYATYRYCQRQNQNADLGGVQQQGSANAATTLIYSLIKLMDLFSTLFFWYLFAMTGYWFVFFKLQSNVYCFLPSLDDWFPYYDYTCIFGVVAGCKIFSLLYKIVYEQCAYDIFLIDWERPKYQNQQTNYEKEYVDVMEIEANVDPKLALSRRKKYVNAWRRLFLLNELSELQSYKLISTELNLILFALIMEGFGFSNLASNDPELELHENKSPQNYTMFFFVTVCVIFGTGLLQYGGRYIFTCDKAFGPLKTTSFVDLCTVLNISVMMFDIEFYGHYIHGKSPYGSAETTGEQLRKNLHAEKFGKHSFRGIHENLPELQTFEIFLSRTQMRDYKTWQNEVTTNLQTQATTNTQNFSSLQKSMNSQSAVPKYFNMNKLEPFQVLMNEMMISYIEKVRKEPDQFIRERTLMERVFKLKPDEGTTRDNTILYKNQDFYPSFGNTLLIGLEFEFLVLDALIITFCNRTVMTGSNIVNPTLLGVLVAYLANMIMQLIKGHFGRKNVGAHCLADERFLM